jgi:hypothetical protein
MGTKTKKPQKNGLQLRTSEASSVCRGDKPRSITKLAKDPFETGCRRPSTFVNPPRQPFLWLGADFHKYGGIRPPMHPASQRCSSVEYSRYAPSSRLARRAPPRPRCVTIFMKGSTQAPLSAPSGGDSFPLATRVRHLVRSMFPFPGSWKRPQSDAKMVRSAALLTIPRLASPDARRHAGRGPRGGLVLTAPCVLGGGALRVLRVKAEPGSWNTLTAVNAAAAKGRFPFSCPTRGREEPMPPPRQLARQ